MKFIFLNRNFYMKNLFFFLLLLPKVLLSQVSIESVYDIESALAQSLVQKATPIGYRILIGFESDKKSADSLKLRFLTAYPRTEAYITFESPNFKLTVGDFRTEIEAQWFAKQLPAKFNAISVQKMQIKLPRID